jgi:FkbM family methyltransferase
MLVTKNNIQFTIGQEYATDGAPFWEWVNNNQWENDTFEYLDKYLKPNTGFLDIGAWMGPLTLYAAAKGHECWSFEPDPVAFNILKDNISLNNFNINLFNLAIGDKDGEVGLGLKGNRGDSMSSILLPNPDNIFVKIVKLSDFILNNKISNISVVKIDIEGYEIMIGDEIFESLKILGYPTLLLSLHKTLYNDTEVNKLLDIFRTHYKMDNGCDIFYPEGDFPQICLIKS